MLQDILQACRWIIDTLQNVFTFVISLFSDFIEIIKVIPGVLSAVTSAIAFLPDIVMVFAVLTIVVSVIYTMAGRDQGGN